MDNRIYVAIDLKSFYASVECVERGYDPLNTNLVVADESRTEKTICLAVSPSLKSYGIPGRPRLFEVVQKVKEVNNVRQQAAPGRRLTGSSVFDNELKKNDSLAVGYVTAKPRMALYMDYSSRIFSVYLKYVSYEDMLEVFKKYFKFRVLKKRKTSYLLDDVSCKKKKVVREEIDNSQSNLSIGCRVHGLTEYERNYPLTLFNVIFGGGCDSKLFKEVREENSLCYTIVSIPNKLDNLLLIRAGIDRYNFNKTMEIIEKDLKDMQKGKFKENDISVAKELFNTAIDETMESQSKIIDNYLMMEFIGTDDLDKKRELMNKVTKKEIVNVAKKVKIDTVFLLEGGK